MRANQHAQLLLMNDDRAETSLAPLMTIGIGAILLAIGILLAFAVLPTVTAANNDVQDDANASDAVKAIANLVPLVFVAVILVGGAAALIIGIKQAL